MRKRIAILLAIIASGGCRACSNCCDYSSPVAESAYRGGGRAGSVLTTERTATASAETAHPVAAWEAADPGD